jgi:hypothetical protein
LDFLSPESKLALAKISNWQSEMRSNWSKSQQLQEEKDPQLVESLAATGLFDQRFCTRRR